ncbi:hypothetical protein QWZ03_15275 [Chitinimonas viridis]|uniref:Uncharacterized protein n=1 Tax=Chitinimonas viridis TaxID=664880 RepID=A0ABT8B8K9_9NEIS|nr:hypothetical protein [Chitinimonas viridis]MDN3578127.1 hypothetical protein [Chitinimonas viridis]
MTHAQAVDHDLVANRVRNRQLECLELWCGYPSYQPGFDINGLINIWGEWVDETLWQDAANISCYTPEEWTLLQQTHMAIEAFCKVTPRNIIDQQAAVTRPEWARLITCARAALQAFQQRGRLAED